MTACEAIAAARSLAFTFPMALCLETAALVVLAGTAATRPAAARLLAAAQAIRERGDRPGPVTLSAAVAQARLSVGTAVTVPASGAAQDLAAALLADLAGSAWMGR